LSNGDRDICNRLEGEGSYTAVPNGDRDICNQLEEEGSYTAVPNGDCDMVDHLEEENMVSKSVNNLNLYNEVVEMRSMLEECPHRMQVQEGVNKAYYVRLVKKTMS
jgi:hypothetical protein